MAPGARILNGEESRDQPGRESRRTADCRHRVPARFQAGRQGLGRDGPVAPSRFPRDPRRPAGGSDRAPWSGTPAETASLMSPPSATLSRPPAARDRESRGRPHRLGSGRQGAVQPRRRGHRLPNPALSPDGTRVAAVRWRRGAEGGGEGRERYEARVWDIATGRALTTIPDCAIVTFDPDGKRLAGVALSPDRSSRAHLWDAVTGEERARLEMPAGGSGALSIAFSPDGRQIAATIIRRDAARIPRIPVRARGMGRGVGQGQGTGPRLYGRHVQP